MSLKQNTNNNNSNLRSKKLVGGMPLFGKKKRVDPDNITLGEPEVKYLLPKIESKIKDYQKIILDIVANAYRIVYKRSVSSLDTNNPFKDWSLISSLIPDDEEKKKYWRFRRILIDSMILYSTCIALFEQQGIKPEQGKAAILFNKQTLREVYKGLECMGLKDTNADEIIKFLNQDIRQAMPDRDTITIDIQAFGSNSVTSDYDISILVPKNENFNTLPAEIFKNFRKLCSAYEVTESPLKGKKKKSRSVEKFNLQNHFNPRINFDTNLYPHPIQFPDSHPIILAQGETIKVNASITAICPTGDSFSKVVTQNDGEDDFKKLIDKVGEGINLDLINANVQLLKYFMDLKGGNSHSGLQINPKCLGTGDGKGSNAILLALVEGPGPGPEPGPGPNVTGDTLHSLFAIQYIRLCEACSLNPAKLEIKVDGAKKNVSANCDEPDNLAICKYGDIDTKESANIQIYTKLIEELLGKGSEGAKGNQSLEHKDYLHLIHQALFYSVETYYSISAIVHVVFILQNKDDAINVKFNKVEGAAAADADAAAAIKKMKIMLAISAIEQFAFILHYLKTYSNADKADADAEAKAKAKATFIKKTAKYVARLCHAHALIKEAGEANLNKLLGIEGKIINKKDLLEVGEYQKIIDKHKDGKTTKDGKEIPIENDPYTSLTPSVKDFIKEMYKKVKTCLETAEVVPTA
jgi:hypothetical protein